jgi:hypothetical protein
LVLAPGYQESVGPPNAHCPLGGRAKAGEGRYDEAGMLADDHFERLSEHIQNIA